MDVFSKKDLKNANIKNLKDLILKFDKDFIFIRNEYRVQIGNNDFFIDLLFYILFGSIELKLGEFKSEYLEKINLYLEEIDRNVKKEQENPSIGVIIFIHLKVFLINFLKIVLISDSKYLFL